MESSLNTDGESVQRGELRVVRPDAEWTVAEAVKRYGNRQPLLLELWSATRASLRMYSRSPRSPHQMADRSLCIQARRHGTSEVSMLQTEERFVNRNDGRAIHHQTAMSGPNFCLQHPALHIVSLIQPSHCSSPETWRVNLQTPSNSELGSWFQCCQNSLYTLVGDLLIRLDTSYRRPGIAKLTSS